MPDCIHDPATVFADPQGRDDTARIDATATQFGHVMLDVGKFTYRRPA